MADSSDVLVSGIQQANDGAQSVAQGAGSMNQGASTLSGGAGALAAALPQIRDGAASAEDGAERLASGASELVSATAAGADGLSGSLAVDSSDMGAYVADPTNARVEKYGALDYYGQGFAPFFMTTSLWLGALMIFFVIEPLYPKQRGAGRLRTVLGRIPSYLAACALEAAAVTAAAFLIGVPSMYSTSPFLLLGYALSVSVCFMLIMQFLNMTLGVAGKALAVLVLILQLACSGGTLPVELGRGFLASMKPFMPFTYAIDGFRETITYANPSVILGDLGILAAAGMIFLMLSLATWDFAEKRRVVETAQFVAWNA
ncbi:YhgE/Pip family protein [Slackia exigua]|uniref:YhgE/Pip family protein n=1 Tax=Slackia exigua TaxID=84109 RepID=UPI003B9E1B6A